MSHSFLQNSFASSLLHTLPFQACNTCTCTSGFGGALVDPASQKNQGGVRRVQRPAFSNTSPPIPVDEHNSRDLAARVAWMNIFHRVSSGRNGGSGSGRNTSHSSSKNLLSRQHGTGLWNSLSLLVLSFQFF